MMELILDLAKKWASVD